MLKISNFIRKYWFIFLAIGLYFFLAALNIMPRGLNIFKKQKLIIDDTPVLVKEIRELGELTTCEFYGEVYADLNEVYDDLIQNSKDSIMLNPEAYFQEFSGLKEYMKNSTGYQDKEIEYKAARLDYDEKLSEHIKKLEAFTEDEKKLKDEIAKTSNGKEKRKLESRHDALIGSIQSENKAFENIKKDFKEKGNDYTEKRVDFWETRKKRNLVYIGRGWVKAGINLKNLTEDEIIVEDDDSASIQILISDPVILDADINPWFIYTEDKKIKGYEVFMAKTGSVLSDKNFTDAEVTHLKMKCKEKLKAAALEKGLLKNASSSATQTLENFFRLLGFKKVSIRFKSNTELVVKEEGS